MRMWGVFMFCVLHILPERKKAFWFFRHFGKPMPPMVQKIPVRGGAFFYDVTVYADRRGEVDLTALPAIVGNSAQRILLCDGIDVDLSPPMRLFTPSLFFSMIFMNSALDFIKVEDTPPEQRILGIVDPDAHLPHAILPFVKLAKTIKVYTKSPKKYEALSAELLEDWGLSLILSDTPQALSDCTVLLDPFAQNGKSFSGLLTLHKNGRSVLSGESIALPPEYAERCPQGADPAWFAAALYELCNVSELKSLCYTHFMLTNPASFY